MNKCCKARIKREPVGWQLYRSEYRYPGKFPLKITETQCFSLSFVPDVANTSDDSFVTCTNYLFPDRGLKYYLFLQSRIGKPVKTFIDSITARGTGALDVPLPISQLIQS